MFAVWPEGNDLPGLGGEETLAGRTRTGSVSARISGSTGARLTMRAAARDSEGRGRPKACLRGLTKIPSISATESSRHATMARARKPPFQTTARATSTMTGNQKSKLESTAMSLSSPGQPWSALRWRKSLWSSADATCVSVGATWRRDKDGRWRRSLWRWRPQC